MLIRNNLSRFLLGLRSSSRTSLASYRVSATVPIPTHTSPSPPALYPRAFSTSVQNMSDIEYVHTEHASPVAGPYSQAIKAHGQVFVSGQIPADVSGNLIEGTIGEKTAACCKNVAAILQAAGSSISKVVKVTVFITDMANFAEVNATYGEYFSHKPARSCVAVYQLPKGVPVEIECVALQ